MVVWSPYVEELVLDLSFKRLLWIWLQFPSRPTSFLFTAKLKRKKKTKMQKKAEVTLKHPE